MLRSSALRIFASLRCRPHPLTAGDTLSWNNASRRVVAPARRSKRLESTLRAVHSARIVARATKRKPSFDAQRSDRYGRTIAAICQSRCASDIPLDIVWAKSYTSALARIDGLRGRDDKESWRQGLIKSAARRWCALRVTRGNTSSWRGARTPITVARDWY